MANLRAAVIGVGYLGHFHAQKFAALEGVDLVGVADTDPATAAVVGEGLGVPWHTDYRAVLGDSDLVSIVVPTELHYRVARDCLEAGLHILVEKPVTRTVEEAQRLVDLARACERVFQVGHLERFNPALLALHGKDWHPLFIESHRLAPFRARGTDVDVILDLMIHDIDIILDMVASPIADIRAAGVEVLTDEVDIASARLEFVNGCVANLTASRVSQQPIRKLRMFQRDEYISIDYLGRSVSISRKAPDGGPGGRPGIAVEEAKIAEGDALMCEIRAFVEAVRSGSEPAVSGTKGQRALEVALEIGQRMQKTAITP